MHNIATVRAASTAFDTIDTTVPGLDGSYSFDNPVLTVANPTAWADKVREVSFLLKADGIVVNPWTEHRVEVLREDLFALRELLNEIPEESFVRPADPVAKPEPVWTDGDVVLTDSPSQVVWIRHHGVWNLPHGVTGSRDVDDETMTQMVALHGWTVIRQQDA